jgi:hypothetical protein
LAGQFRERERFEVFRSETGPDGTFRLVATTSANVTARSDLGLAASTQYCYRIRALSVVAGATSYSSFSNAACATTLPPASTALNAPSATNVTPVSSTAVQITWVDNSANEEWFRVQRSVDLGVTWTTYYTLSANRTSANDSGLTSEKRVCYRVIAFNAQGESSPSEADCTTPPAAPTDLTVAAVDLQTTNLAWTDNSTVEDGYQVERMDGTTAYTVVAQLAPNSTSYRDVGVPGGATYRVRATKDGGSSYYSNVASMVPPNAPGGVSTHPAWSSTALGITWADNSTNENGFRVERSTDGGGSWVTAGTTGADPPYLSWPEKFIDAGRTSEQPVCYRVFAFNNVGDSPPSNTDCTVPPAAPTGLTVTATAEGTLVNWTDNSAVEDGYVVVLMIDCLESPEWWVDLPANSTSFLDNLGPWCFGPTLGYQVMAVKDGGYSDSATVP